MPGHGRLVSCHVYKFLCITARAGWDCATKESGAAAAGAAACRSPPMCYVCFCTPLSMRLSRLGRPSNPNCCPMV